MLLDFHPLCLSDVLPIHIQRCVQVGGGVSSVEDREQCRVLHRVGSLGVHKLEIKLEAPPAFVTSQLHPELIMGDCSFMPC